jgi:hypothetical protein
VDACFTLLLVAFAVVVLTAVGHALWLVAAATFRVLFHPARPASSPAPPAATRCVLCRRRGPAVGRYCPACGLDRQCDEAVQLGELEAAIRQIGTLTRAEELERGAAEAALRSLGRRRRQLIRRLNARLGRETEAAPATHLPAASLPEPVVSVAPAAPVPAAEEMVLEALPVEPVERPRPLPVAVKADAPAAAPRRPEPVEVPRPPRRSFGEMLAAFMEERNILWGELAGGLLIVGCSIALVISLRETLEGLPYFPFLIVGAVTAALIGAGRYTLSHWKLEATSRGLLVIGTMLVPLSFMVLAGLAASRERGAVAAAVEVAAVALFGWLVRGAADVLVRRPAGPAAPRPDWLTTAALLGASVSLLLVSHIEAWAGPGSGLLGLVGYAPAAVFVLTQALAWHAVYRRESVSPRQASGLFVGLSLSAYALAVAFGYLLYRTADVGQALEYLAVPVALAGLPLLYGGTVASAGLRGAEANPAEGEEGGLSAGVAGVLATALTLSGGLVLLLALVAAWPHPVRLTVIGLLDCVVLSLVAQRFRLAAAYVPAQVGLAVAALTGFHLLAGHLDVPRAEWGHRLLAAWAAPESGVVLLALAGLLAAAAEWRARSQRALDARYLVCGAGVAAVGSLLLVALDGRGSPGRAAWVFGACAAGAWVVNARWRLSWLTSAAAAVLFGAAVFAFHWQDPQAPLAQALVWALLADAVAVLMLAAAVGRRAGEEDEVSQGLRRAFVVPLERAALAAAVAAAVGLVPAARWAWLAGAAGAALGVGCVWLALAWRWRSAGLFAAFQVALAVAVVFGCVRAVQIQAWFTAEITVLLREVRAWQACGAGLSALALAWALVRFGLRKNERAWALLEPGWPAADRLLLGGLVVVAVVVAATGVAGGVAEELTPLAAGAGPVAATPLHLGGVVGWCWLGLLVLALGLTLWQGRAPTAVPGLTAVALCAGVTAAAAFGEAIAVASALRWCLALAFFGVSALLWLRGRLAPLAAAAGIPQGPGATTSARARAVLLVGAVAPVLLLTGAVAALGFARLHPSGPLPGSFFARLGPVVNVLSPLALLCVGLAGHGLRERSAGYAFAAGQVALAAVVGGQALGLIAGGAALGAGEGVQLGQLATAVLAVWLLGWLAARRFGRRAMPESDAAAGKHPGVLLATQEGLTWVSHLLWLAPALALLGFPDAFSVPAGVTALVQHQTGAWLGWLAVGLAVVAGVAYRQDTAAAVPSWLVGLAAALVAGLASCTVATVTPEWGQRSMMLAAALLSLGFVLTLVRWAASPSREWLTTSRGAATELALACGMGGLAVALAVQRAVGAHDFYWAAAAAGVVAGAAAAAALLQRGEGWMFAASLLAMLAASLLVCGVWPAEWSARWVVLLVQVNLAAAAAVGLLWLSLLPQLSPDDEGDRTDRPWLWVQHGLTYCGNLALLSVGLVLVVLGGSGRIDSFVLALGGVAGWLALVPAAAGAVWALRVLAPRQAIHVLVGAGLMAGVLAACSAAHAGPADLWLDRHVLTLAWLLTAAGLLGASWAADRRRAESEGAPPAWTELLPRPSAARWVVGVGAAVALLAFAGGRADPYRPYWPCAVVLAVSAILGAAALWTRRGGLVYGSGLLFNAAGQLAWWAWAENAAAPTDALWYRLALVYVTCLALASFVWSVIERAGRRVLPVPVAAKGAPPFQHLAAWAALGLLAVAVGAALASDVAVAPPLPRDPALWFALAAMLAAAAAELWEGPGQRWAGPLPQLYALGLLAIGGSLHQTERAPEWLAWSAAVALGPYALLTALVCRSGLRDSERGEAPDQSARPGGWPLGWFVPAQAVLSGAAAGFGVWACLSFADLTPRLAGFWAVAFLVPAWAVLAPHWGRLTARRAPRPHADAPRFVALLLAVLAAACLHVAFVGPAHGAPWLHRSVLLMAALTAMSLLYGLLLPRLLPAGGGWAAPARRMATPLGLAACGALLLVLVQEFALYDPALRRAPLALPGALTVAAALAALAGGSLTFALSPARDLFRLSERRRTLYVYAAEGLLALLLAHLRLNLPEVFRLFGGRYWAFAVMAVAFLGVGLGELCRRRGLRVLADPLQRTAMFLPLLPLAAFLLRPLTGVPAGGELGARLLGRLPDDYRWHAALWFLTGLLYLTLSLTRRSSGLALAAAVLANFGLWVLFGHHDRLTFLAHPQLWLVPVGLIVLAAEQVNRGRLRPAQAQALRYAGLLLVYLSSTADLFIAGLGEGVWPAVVLALLAVAGVLLGILLRVRAFLFLGVAFLALDVFAQVWHAAVGRHQTWVWWACGVVLGAAILALFALFEKRRNDVRKVLDALKGWR